MSINKKQRLTILSKFNYHCAYCGCRLDMVTMQVDHIIPQARFAQHVRNMNAPYFLSHLQKEDINHPDNLFPSCRACNFTKDTFTIEKFREKISEKLMIVQKTFNFKLLKKYGFVQEIEKPVIFYFETLWQN